ncbi:hypothetical protein IVB18_10720 [Bradyrhizobium sp. 186]|uniref:hypothetical protein n=1 Tax=Bradyrhizobium sp. 186 TaxID=2782654 RepID=UPI00200072AC|nr:hypothetical protein [Bradyrhizobium sp. 186]UPK37727.1 hypothetical protein IVB18_10720 [Bradyrhizobium sp. 186]
MPKAGLKVVEHVRFSPDEVSGLREAVAVITSRQHRPIAPPGAVGFFFVFRSCVACCSRWYRPWAMLTFHGPL